MIEDPTEQPSAAAWGNIAKPSVRIIGEVKVTHNRDGGVTETIPTANDGASQDD